MSRRKGESERRLLEEEDPAAAAARCRARDGGGGGAGHGILMVVCVCVWWRLCRARLRLEEAWAEVLLCKGQRKG